jgi:hypothetical protein
VRVEFPVFIAIGAVPLAAVVAPFVGKAHGDALFAEGPQFLDQPVFLLALPFSVKNVSMAARPE